MSSNSINSRMAARRNHSLTRRWTSGRGIRRRSGRGGKSRPRASAPAASLAFPPFQPHQKTIAQHYGDGVAMKAIPAPSLILIPAQLGFSFLMILLDPVAAVGILDHPGQRRGGREITPEILPVPVLAPSGALPKQPAHMAAAVAIDPPAAQCAKLRPPPALGPCAPRNGLPILESLIQIATIHVQHMQKALDQMNLQLHHVISDITGVSAIAIIEAILNGERDPLVLSKMCDKRIKASRPTIAAALVGDYRREHLFTLRQSLYAYRQSQELIAACDREIEQHLAAFDSMVELQATPLPKPKDRHKPRHNQMKFDLRAHMYRVYGVDLTAVPGIDALTAHVLFAEIGPDLSQFISAAAFVSWLGLCPDNRISGGKLLSAKTRVVKSRVAKALRMAAQSLHRSQSYLGSYYRRMRTRLGTPKAITAAAHKLARVMYHLLTTRQSYEESGFARCEALHQQRLEHRIRRQARDLGFDLVRSPS